MGVVGAGELKPSISGKRPFRPSSGSRLNPTDWPILDDSSDLAIEVGGTSLALHKSPLVSRCGKIKKLFDARDSKVTRVYIPALPGGFEAFELCAKFCYGVSIEITQANVAMLKCASYYLEMTEEFSEKNLETLAEVYLMEKILPNILSSIHVLHHCEALLPVAEEISLVGRIINAIANNAGREELTSGLSKLEHTFSGKHIPETTNEAPSDPDWWGKLLAILDLHFFQRVMCAVKSKGLKQSLICKILINYTQNSLQRLLVARDSPSVSTNIEARLDLEVQRKRRLVIEAIVSLLPNPSRKSSVPMAFLSTLLKHTVAASASISCRSDLEKRIGLQLDQAILEDILIPSNPHGGSTLNSPMYDTDSISRICSIFLNLDEDDDDENPLKYETETGYDFDGPGSPKQSAIFKVSKLFDTYLAEIALDPNLSTSKFISLAELLPDHARMVNDGLYRAVDIFLKVHPNLTESDRHNICKTIDCQKLSEEACSHAAQNERLPVQMAVQVLYFEQSRLRNALSSGCGGGHSITTNFLSSSISTQFPQRAGGSEAVSPRDNYASVRRENRELKLEVARMRMRLTDLEKEHLSMKEELVKPHPANKIFKSFAKTLVKFNATIFRVNPENHFIFQKRRRNSIS